MDTQVYEFDALIIDANPGAYVMFPFDAQQMFGRKTLKVLCLFDGIPYRGSLVDMGAGPCVGLPKSIRLQLNKEAGDMVHVQLSRDEAPREVVMPPELHNALEAQPEAADFFQTLSYTNRKAYADWVKKAKTTETLLKRVRESVQMLQQRQKSPR